jgi:enoyl-CoA hydratase/carnithine racemase
MASQRSKLNLLDTLLMRNLHRTMHFLSSDMGPSARVAILAAEERCGSFSAGLDLKVNSEILHSEEGVLASQCLGRLIGMWQDSVSSIARCRVPVIGAIHGHCIGGATSIITACDFRLCTRDATFSVREPKVGVTADIGVLQRLPRIVGEGRARELCFTARTFGSEEALSYGLVERVYDDYSALLDGARKMAAEIATNSPLAVQGTKNIMNHQSERAVQDSLDYVRLWNAANLRCNDVEIAGKAFASKSFPQFIDYTIDPTSTSP